VHDQSTSLTLLQRARDRNQEAWKQLHYLYGPLVDLWSRSWGLQDAEVDDIRQEVFQSVASSLESFRHNRPGDSFRGWLWVIARRKFLDHCRARAKQPEAKGGSGAYLRLLEVPEAAEPDETVPNDPPEELTRLHHRALDLIRSQFEARTWQAFWRCAVDGQSPADVAQELSMSPAGVRKAKSRVLHRFKSELGDLL
jgi:RNA polymerase sigma-70 factor (ECF subfamily)